jgi:hypothetical protein
MSILRKIFGFGKTEAAPQVVDAKVEEINNAPYKVEAPVTPPPIVKAEPVSAPAKVAPVKKATPRAPAKPKTTKTK